MASSQTCRRTQGCGPDCPRGPRGRLQPAPSVTGDAGRALVGAAVSAPPATHREYPGESGCLHHRLHPQALTAHMLAHQHLHASRNVPAWVMPGGPRLGSVWQQQGPIAEGRPSGVRQACVHSEVTTSSHVARLPRRPGKVPCEQLLEPSRACSLPGQMWTPQCLGSRGRPSL